jgi:hypothetical protein
LLNILLLNFNRFGELYLQFINPTADNAVN